MPGSCEKNGIFIGLGEIFQTRATVVFGLIDGGEVVIKGTTNGFVAQSEHGSYQHFEPGQYLDTTAGRIVAVAVVGAASSKPKRWISRGGRARRRWWSRRSR